MSIQTNDLYILIFLQELHHELSTGKDLRVAVICAIDRAFRRIREQNESNLEDDRTNAVKKITDKFFNS